MNRADTSSPKRAPGGARAGAAILSVTAATVLGLSAAARAEPTLNLYGTTGLIDMPSAEAQSDGTFSVAYSRVGPYSRTAMTFQISPRLSGTFRYQAARNWDRVVPFWLETNYMRNFDMRFLLLEEGQTLPAISVGVQDFIGTGGESAEYLVATKSFGDRLKVTAGLGWGRLGGLNPIGAPFGARPDVAVGLGGKPSFSNWFKGNVAPFGGLEYKVSDKLSVKVEYSSDIYPHDAGYRQIFDRRSPFNFGVEYQVMPAVRLGAYSFYGSEFGFSAQIALDPKRRIGGGPAGPAPAPIAPRKTAGELGWSGSDLGSAETRRAMHQKLNEVLAGDGIAIEAAEISGSRAVVRVTSSALDSRGQTLGRIARAMANNLPGSIETFEIIPISDGLALSRVTIQRRDLESLEHAPANDEAIYAAARFSAVSGGPSDLVTYADSYPRFDWGVTPYIKPSFFDPYNPARADLLLRLSGQAELRPGLVAQGSVSKRLAGNLSSGRLESDSVLPKVRTEGAKYDYFGDPSIESLTLSWYTKPAENLYGRVSVGYLEPMFAGVSGELLWKSVDKPYALGIELNYARQRAYNQLLGLRDYSIVTGHVSGYYSLENGYTAQLDVGRYLAGDYGATLTLAREFENGWRVGAFATLTNVSAADFGEGSFDKGIILQIPFGWVTGGWTQKKFTYLLRPIQRDGGARLDVEGRLYEKVRGYHADELQGQFTRFWR